MTNPFRPTPEQTTTAARVLTNPRHVLPGLAAATLGLTALTVFAITEHAWLPYALFTGSGLLTLLPTIRGAATFVAFVAFTFAVIGGHPMTAVMIAAIPTVRFVHAYLAVRAAEENQPQGHP